MELSPDPEPTVKRRAGMVAGSREMVPDGVDIVMLESPEAASPLTTMAV